MWFYSSNGAPLDQGTNLFWTPSISSFFDLGEWKRQKTFCYMLRSCHRQGYLQAYLQPHSWGALQTQSLSGRRGVQGSLSQWVMHVRLVPCYSATQHSDALTYGCHSLSFYTPHPLHTVQRTQLPATFTPAHLPDHQQHAKATLFAPGL